MKEELGSTLWLDVRTFSFFKLLSIHNCLLEVYVPKCPLNLKNVLTSTAISNKNDLSAPRPVIVGKDWQSLVSRTKDKVPQSDVWRAEPHTALLFIHEQVELPATKHR